jgi:hypothetical protein
MLVVGLDPLALGQRRRDQGRPQVRVDPTRWVWATQVAERAGKSVGGPVGPSWEYPYVVTDA